MSILVVLEQQRGARGERWNRMSWETLAAGQQIGAALGVPVQAAVAGHGINALAAEAATRNLAKVYAAQPIFFVSLKKRCDGGESPRGIKPKAENRHGWRIS